MKWESRDIRAGLRVRKPGCHEVWMIGYDPARHGRDTPAFALLSLTDGMISTKDRSPEQLADLLNDAGKQPVFLVGEND